MMSSLLKLLAFSIVRRLFRSSLRIKRWALFLAATASAFIFFGHSISATRIESLCPSWLFTVARSATSTEAVDALDVAGPGVGGGLLSRLGRKPGLPAHLRPLPPHRRRHAPSAPTQRPSPPPRRRSPGTRGQQRSAT